MKVKLTRAKTRAWEIIDRHGYQHNIKLALTYEDRIVDGWNLRAWVLTVFSWQLVWGYRIDNLREFYSTEVD